MVEFHESAIHEVHAGWTLTMLDWTSGMRHVVWVEQSAEGVRAVVDGEPSATFDELVPAGQSDDGERLAWVGVWGDKNVVLVDNMAGPAFTDISAQAWPMFSPDGSHLVYGALDDEHRCYLVRDGEMHTDDLLAPVRPVFSQDGAHFAYAAQDSTARKGQQWVVRDGAAGPKVDGLCQLDETPKGLRSSGNVLLMSADGAHLVYGGGRGTTKNVYVDDVPGPDFADITPPVMSPDGSRIAYSARRGKREPHVLVVDGVESEGYSVVGPAWMSPDGRHVACAVGRAERRMLRRSTTWMILLDGELLPAEFKDVLTLATFSPDGQRFAAGVRSERGNRLFVDGTVWSSGFDECHEPGFSPDSTRLVVLVNRGKKRVVITDDVPGREYEHVLDGGFAESGSAFVYAAVRDGRHVLVCDEEEGPAFDEIDAERLFVEPGGEHVAYVARSAGECVPVMDHVKGPAADSWVGGALEDGRASFLGRRGSTILRLDANSSVASRKS